MRQVLRGARTLWLCALLTLSLAAPGCRQPEPLTRPMRQVALHATSPAAAGVGVATPNQGDHAFTVSGGPVLIRAYQVRNGVQMLKAWMVFDPEEHSTGFITSVVRGDQAAIEFGGSGARQSDTDDARAAGQSLRRVAFPRPQHGLRASHASYQQTIGEETPVLTYIVSESKEAVEPTVELSGPQATEVVRARSEREPRLWFVMISFTPASKEDRARELAMESAVHELDAQERESAEEAGAANVTPPAAP